MIDLPNSNNLPKIIKAYVSKLGWSLAKLSRASSVSQSMINQIISGRKKPSYDTAYSLINALNNASKESNVKAGSISTKKVISLNPNMSVNDAIKLMSDKYDQIPVIENGISIGTITTNLILKLSTTDDFKTKKVSEVMENSLPIIDEDESINKVKKLLEAFEAVLTSKKGIITGIITKSDLIKKT